MASKRRIVVPSESEEESERLLRFVLLRPFERNWRQLGLSEDELAALEVAIMAAPEAPPVMSGTGGLRKIRFARGERGKSGAQRVCYAYFPRYGIVFLVTVFGKAEKANLTRAEKTEIGKLLREIEQLLRTREIR